MYETFGKIAANASNLTTKYVVETCFDMYFTFSTGFFKYLQFLGLNFRKWYCSAFVEIEKKENRENIYFWSQYSQSLPHSVKKSLYKSELAKRFYRHLKIHCFVDNSRFHPEID